MPWNVSVICDRTHAHAPWRRLLSERGYKATFICGGNDSLPSGADAPILIIINRDEGSITDALDTVQTVREAYPSQAPLVISQEKNECWSVLAPGAYLALGQRKSMSELGDLVDSLVCLNLERAERRSRPRRKRERATPSPIEPRVARLHCSTRG